VLGAGKKNVEKVERVEEYYTERHRGGKEELRGNFQPPRKD